MTNAPARLVPLKALVFDLGDTLFDATPWRRAMSGCLQSVGIAIDHAGFCAVWERELIPVYLGCRVYWTALADCLGGLGLSGEVLDAAMAFARQTAREAASCPLFDGVHETLATLAQQGVKMAVLTDSESTELTVRRRLAAWGIDHCFQAVVTSRDIGYVKPWPEAYREATRRLGVSECEAGFVGHDAEELQGAKTIGMTAIAVDGADAQGADVLLSQFADLAAVKGPFASASL